MGLPPTSMSTVLVICPSVPSTEYWTAIAPPEEVRHGMELARGWIAKRMSGVTARQRAVEVARADGVELEAQLVGARSRLDEGEGAPGMANDVGVRSEVEASVNRNTGRGRLLAQLAGDRS